jgi:hypothetical protein
LDLLSVTSGANPVSLKKGIDKTVQGIIEELEKKARPVKGGGDIKGDCCYFQIRSFVFHIFSSSRVEIKCRVFIRPHAYSGVYSVLQLLPLSLLEMMNISDR